jgi:hypothetical protein
MNLTLDEIAMLSVQSDYTIALIVQMQQRDAPWQRDLTVHLIQIVHLARSARRRAVVVVVDVSVYTLATRQKDGENESYRHCQAWDINE